MPELPYTTTALPDCYIQEGIFYFFIVSCFIHNFLLFCLILVGMACLRDRLRLCLSTTVMRTLCSLYTVFCTISFITQFIHTKQLRPSQLMKIILFVYTSKREHEIKKVPPDFFGRAL